MSKMLITKHINIWLNMCWVFRQNAAFCSSYFRTWATVFGPYHCPMGFPSPTPIWAAALRKTKPWEVLSVHWTALTLTTHQSDGWNSSCLFCQWRHWEYWCTPLFVSDLWPISSLKTKSQSDWNRFCLVQTNPLKMIYTHTRTSLWLNLDYFTQNGD